jgi:hypothetical protein
MWRTPFFDAGLIPSRNAVANGKETQFAAKDLVRPVSLLLPRRKQNSMVLAVPQQGTLDQYSGGSYPDAARSTMANFRNLHEGVNQ